MQHPVFITRAASWGPDRRKWLFSAVSGGIWTPHSPVLIKISADKRPLNQLTVKKIFFSLIIVVNSHLHFCFIYRMMSSNMCIDCVIRSKFQSNSLLLSQMLCFWILICVLTVTFVNSVLLMICMDFNRLEIAWFPMVGRMLWTLIYIFVSFIEWCPVICVSIASCLGRIIHFWFSSWERVVPSIVCSDLCFKSGRVGKVVPDNHQNILPLTPPYCSWKSN